MVGRSPKRGDFLQFHLVISLGKTQFIGNSFDSPKDAEVSCLFVELHCYNFKEFSVRGL